MNDTPEARRRQRALASAVPALMERAISLRLGHGKLISGEGHDLVHAAINAVAISEQAREDFVIQAEELAADAVDREWAEIEPLLVEGVPVFRGPADWPTALMGLPLYPVKGPSSAAVDGLSAYEMGVRHRVAHGIVAAAVTGAAIPVGFSGFSMPPFTPGWDRLAQILLAGRVIETMLPGRGGSVDICECGTMLTDVVLAALHLDDVAHDGTIGDVLAAAGRTAEYEAFVSEQCEAAADLLGRALETGLIDRESARLSAHGRIVVEPTEVALSLHRFSGSDAQDDCAAARVGEGAAGGGSEVRRYDLRRMAFGQAAMAVTARHLEDVPVFATLTVCLPAPALDPVCDPAITAFAVAISSLLARSWLWQRPDGDVPPNWDEVALPGPEVDATEASGADLALETLKAHWTEVIDTATLLLETGSVTLSAPRSSSHGIVSGRGPRA